MGKHKHAEVIKAWADGATIECKPNCRPWLTKWAELKETPQWHEDHEYRIKPEPPAKSYPFTGMTVEEKIDAFNAAPNGTINMTTFIANAALRHAIDSKQLVEPVDGLTTWARELHLKMSEALVKELKKARRTLELAGYTDNGGELWKPPLGKSPDDRPARDLAIAEAVMTAFLHSRFTITGNDGIDLPAIIATVKE